MARVENMGEVMARHHRDRPFRTFSDDELDAIVEAERALSGVAKESIMLPLARVSTLAACEQNERDYQERMRRDGLDLAGAEAINPADLTDEGLAHIERAESGDA